MTVKEAFEIVNTLKADLKLTIAFIGNNPYHGNYEEARRDIKILSKEIERLEELIYNQELDDSYDQNGEDI